jgi:hypothetical protein
MKWLLAKWNLIPLKYRKEIISFLHTFLGVFAGVMMLGLAEGAWTKEALIALIVSAIRSAIKVAWNAVARYDE